MAYDEKTPHLSLPLPHPRNTLREDCPRIRESLQALDRFAEKSDAAVAALAEADTTLANAMQSQREDLTLAFSREQKERTEADSALEEKLGSLCAELRNIDDRFSEDGHIKAEHLPLTDALDSATGQLAASDTAVKTLNDRLNGLSNSPADSRLWIGVPRPWRSTALPPNHCWANGDFVAFADWPELKAVYEAGGFEGMLLPWDADGDTQAANLGQWRPDAADPTGLFTPNLTGQFFRNWGPGADKEAGVWGRDEIRNITGVLNHLFSSNDSAPSMSGAFRLTSSTRPYRANQAAQSGTNLWISFAAANVVPTGVQNVPQHVWQPVILYLGQPATSEEAA